MAMHRSTELKEQWSRLYNHTVFVSDPQGTPYKRYAMVSTEEFDEFNAAFLAEAERGHSAMTAKSCDLCKAGNEPIDFCHESTPDFHAYYHKVADHDRPQVTWFIRCYGFRGQR